MCIISIADTQEAPKSLSLDSGSSMESLASVAHTEKNLVERPRLGGAFASYVRHRGEPDGKTMEPPNVLIPASRQPCQNGGGIHKYLEITRQNTRIEYFLSFSNINDSHTFTQGSNISFFHKEFHKIYMSYAKI